MLASTTCTSKSTAMGKRLNWVGEEGGCDGNQILIPFQGMMMGQHGLATALWTQNVNRNRRSSWFPLIFLIMFLLMVSPH